MGMPNREPLGAEFPARLRKLMSEWLKYASSTSTGGLNQSIQEVSRVLCEVTTELPPSCRNGYVHALAIELLDHAMLTECTQKPEPNEIPRVEHSLSTSSPAAPTTAKKRRSKPVIFHGSFNMREDSELLDLGYSTKPELTEKQRRDLLLTAYKAAPGAGGRVSGTKFWFDPGTPQRLSAIAFHLHHLMTYRVDRRTADRKKLKSDLDWLKQVLYWPGSGIQWPLNKS